LIIFRRMRPKDNGTPIVNVKGIPGDIHKKISDLSLTSLIIKYLITIIDIQKILFSLAFLTYGLGDGITAVYLMDKNGVMSETNPIVRFMYISSGVEGVIALKAGFTLMILLFVWTISRKEKIYWTVNGFLSALCIGGIMAIRANLMAAEGITPPSPDSIIITYLFLTVLFVMIGDQMDKLNPHMKKPASTGTPS
jgi:hypothetical protein